MTATVAILAGGSGSRLRERTGDLPKPMVAVAGRPLLEHQIEQCRAAGFTRIALLVHFRHVAISAHFGDGSRFGVHLDYRVETAPRGTGGALRDAAALLAPTFLVLYGDTYFDVDLRALWRAHEEHDADATLLLHPNSHPHDSDLVEIDEAGFVRKLWPHPRPAAPDRRNVVNAALYVMRRDALTALVPALGTSDLARDAFPAMLAGGRRLAGYLSVEYIKDIGTPERLDRVEAEIAQGVPERLSARALRPAVFLDRDGTLNHEVDHLRDADELRLHAGAGDAVRRLNHSGTLTIVVTNQPMIARGELTSAGLASIHARLDTLLGAAGAYVDRVYYCPHHPHRGFAGEVSALKIQCDCRKPATGMIDAACRDLAVDRTRSWMVGDSTTDIVAGQRAGLKTILLHTGYGGADGKHAIRPDYVMSGLPHAVDWILHGHDAASRRLAPAALAALDVRLALIGGLPGAGKSTAAQLLKEIVAGCGRRAHVIALDAWVDPGERHPERADDGRRMDWERARHDLEAVVRSTERVTAAWQPPDPRSGAVRCGAALSIAPDDLLIVEGVEALLHAPLRALAGLCLHMAVDEPERRRRLESAAARCADRNGPPAPRPQSRAVDEAAVTAAAVHAHLRPRLQDFP